MAADPNSVELAVSRTLRDNLEKIQRISEELHQAVNDLVSACASSRPSNALPPMVRAQTSAAALSATLDVLSRFVTASLQPAAPPVFESESLHVPSIAAPAQRLPVEQAAPPVPKSLESASESLLHLRPLPANPPAIREAPKSAPIFSNPEIPPPDEMPAVDFVPILEPGFMGEPVPVFVRDPVAAPEAPAAAAEPEPLAVEEQEPIFSLDSLPPEEQELHRRAYRVAKVSMQDIKMLRPEEVRAGRENKDICIRLGDEIEKAHKEYERRFQAIQDHPVDYFYDWLVEILAGGDPSLLGAYPYSSPVVHG